MAAANFDDCYAQVCDLLGLEPVALTPDDKGTRAFTVHYNNADFSFVERKGRAEDSASMLVRFGLPPAEKLTEALVALMGANFMLMEQGAPAFVQSPHSGEIFLHRLLPLSQLHVQGLQDAFDEFAQQVARWSGDHFLGASDADAPQALPAGQLA